jgi:hypothetical protein
MVPLMKLKETNVYLIIKTANTNETAGIGKMSVHNKTLLKLFDREKIEMNLTNNDKIIR